VPGGEQHLGRPDGEVQTTKHPQPRAVVREVVARVLRQIDGRVPQEPEEEFRRAAEEHDGRPDQPEHARRLALPSNRRRRDSASVSCTQRRGVTAGIGRTEHVRQRASIRDVEHGEEDHEDKLDKAEK